MHLALHAIQATPVDGDVAVVLGVVLACVEYSGSILGFCRITSKNAKVTTTKNDVRFFVWKVKFVFFSPLPAPNVRKLPCNYIAQL